MRIRIPVVAAVLLAALPPGAFCQPGEAVLQGAVRSTEALREMHLAERAHLEEFDRAPPADPAVRERERAALASAVDGLRRLAEIQSRIDRAPALKAEAERQIQAAAASLTEARVLAQRPPRFESMGREQLLRIEAAAHAAAQGLPPAEAALAAADSRIQERASLFERIGDEAARAEQAFEKARDGVEATPPGTPDAARLAREALAAECELRILESSRDFHSTLAEMDFLSRDLARARLDLARALAARAAAEEAAARTARESTLEAEAQAVREAAARATAEAERTRMPAERAVSTLAAAVARSSASLKEEQAGLSRLRGFHRSLEALLKQVASRNEAVGSLFPEGAAMDDWRVHALGQLRTRLRDDERGFAEGARRQARRLPETLRILLADRDRLEGLAAALDLQDDGGGIRFSEFMQDEPAGDGSGLWRSALADLEAGIEGLPAPMEQDLRRRFEQQRKELADVTAARIQVLADSGQLVREAMAKTGEIETAFQDRARFLERISFWLRGPPPLGPGELREASRDLRNLAASIPAAPRALGEAWTSAAARTGGTAVALAAVLALLLAAWAAGRRLSRAYAAVLAQPGPDAHDGLGRVRRLLWGLAGPAGCPLLLLLPAGARALILEPGDMVARMLFWGLLAWAGIQSGRGLVAALLSVIKNAPRDSGESPPDPGEATIRVSIEEIRGGEHSHSFRYFQRLVILIAILVPASLALGDLGHTRLATLLRLGLATLGLIWAVRIYFRPDLIEGFLPGGDSSLARGIRIGLLRVWPLAVLFCLGILLLRLWGYQTAAWYYASRSLLCGAVLVGATILYQLIQGYLTRRLGPPLAAEDGQDFAEDPGPGAMRRSFFRRAFGSLALFGTIIAAAAVTGSILGLAGGDWSEVLSTTLWPRSGRPPLTLGDLAVSLSVFVAALFLARLVRDGLQILLREKMQRGPRYAVRTVAFYLIAGIGCIMALSALGLELDQLGWFLTAAGVGIGFGLQEVISNFISGLILFFERPVQVGDVISIGSIEGDVVRISIRSTIVRTRDGISIIIPNKRLIVDDVINWSHGDPKTRLRLPVTVARGSDLALVRKILLEVAGREGRVLSRPRPEVNFLGFGESSLDLELLAWLPRPDITLRRRVRSDLNAAVDAAFRRAGVQIPFPRRDVLLARTPPKAPPRETEEGGRDGERTRELPRPAASDGAAD